MTRGRVATPDPFDLGAVAGSDELFEALSTRRLAGLNIGAIDSEDPAAALLAALVADVDAGAPPMVYPPRKSRGTQGTRRRGVRVVVAFGVAALVLTSAGAAAAGGGNGVDAMSTKHGPVRSKGAERSNENIQRHTPMLGPTLTGRRALARHAGDKRHVGLPEDDQARDPGDQQWSHRSHRSSRGYTRLPVDAHPESPDPGASWGPRPPTPTPTPTPSPDQGPVAP